MSKNEIKEIDIKDRDDTINIKSLDLNKIKIDQQSYKHILIYHISCVTSNSVKPLYLIINKVNGYIDEYNGNKY